MLEVVGGLVVTIVLVWMLFAAYDNTSSALNSIARKEASKWVRQEVIAAYAASFIAVLVGIIWWELIGQNITITFN